MIARGWLRLMSPVGWWRLGEASGTTATDSGSAAVDGEYQNTPTLGTASMVADDPATATTFAAASSEDVAIADDDAWSIDTTGEFSGVARVRFTTLPALGIIIGKGQAAGFEYLFGGAGDQLFINIYTPAPALIGQAISAAGALTTGIDLTLGFSVNFAEDRAYIYLNGIRVGANEALADVGDYANGVVALAIAAGNGTSPDNFADAVVQDVALFDFEMSAEQHLATHLNFIRPHRQLALTGAG